MNPLFREAALSILRHLLGWASGFIVARGIWTSDQATLYVGAAAMAILTFGFALWSVYSKRIKILTALTMPQGTTEREVEAQMQTGMTPSVSTPKNVVPVPTV